MCLMEAPSLLFGAAELELASPLGSKSCSESTGCLRRSIGKEANQVCLGFDEPTVWFHLLQESPQDQIRRFQVC